MSRANDGIHDVWSEGGRADGSACLAAAQAAYRKHKTRCDKTVWPAVFVPGTVTLFPGYTCAGNPLAALATDAGIAWAANTAYIVGDLRSIATSSTVVLACTTAGTSGSSEPVAGAEGDPVADGGGTLVWTYRIKRKLTPGGRTECHQRVVISTGTIIIPGGHWWEGDLETPINDGGISGHTPHSEILCSGAYPTNSRIVQLGYDDYPADGAFPQHCGMSRMGINGRDRAGVIGVYSNSIQESSGLRDMSIRGVYHGVIFEGAANVGPANFTIERLHVVLAGANPGYGANVYGTNWRAKKPTTVQGHATTTGDAGFTMRGSNGVVSGGHAEGFDFGIDIGGLAPGGGAGFDNGFWTFNQRVEGFTAFNLTTQPPLQAVARIRNLTTHVFNIELLDLGLHVFNQGLVWVAGTTYAVGDCRSISTSTSIHLVCTAITTGVAGGSEPAVGIPGATVVDGGVTWTYRYTALVQDDVNGIVIPASAINQKLGYYRFFGDYTITSGNSVKRPVETSYYAKLCAANAAVKAMPIGAATALDRSFVDGGLAGIIQATSTSGVLQSLSDPYHGAVVYVHWMQAGTIDHNNGGAAAAERIHCAGGSDLTPAADSFYRFTYGDPRGSASWTTSLASANSTFDRWYAELVA